LSGLIACSPPPGTPLPIYSVSLPYTWRTPFELASAHRAVRRGTIGLLAAISRELERQAAAGSRTSLLISSFPGVDQWMSQMNEVYRELADELAFAFVLGVGIPPEPSPALKGVNIYEDDPVSGTWNVIVISGTSRCSPPKSARELAPQSRSLTSPSPMSVCDRRMRPSADAQGRSADESHRRTVNISGPPQCTLACPERQDPSVIHASAVGE
jgi:diguanylate cyclase/two-component system sensory protein